MSKKIATILLFAISGAIIFIICSRPKEQLNNIERIRIERELLPQICRTDFAKERQGKVQSEPPTILSESNNKDEKSEENKKKLLLEQTQHKATPKRTTQPSSEDMTKAEKKLKMEQRRQAVKQSWEGVSQPAQLATKGVVAVIHGNQIIKSGQTVTIRSIEKYRFDDGHTLEANTLIFGVASFSNNRLNIQINNIRIENQIIPISLSVHATDGMIGIPISNQEVKKELSNSAASSAASKLTTAVKSYGSWIGSVAGSAADIAVSKLQNQRDMEIQLIDNQTIYLL